MSVSISLIRLLTNPSRDLIMPESDSRDYFQQGSPILTTTVHPEGSDTTSLVLAVLDNVPMDTKLKARDEILINLNSDGLPLVSL